jgi:uncharacterized membrane protein
MTPPLRLVSLLVALLAGVVHVLIFCMESLWWTSPRVRARFRHTPEHAEVTRLFAFNQGFYNLFLAVGTFAGLVLVVVGHPAVGLTLVSWNCLFMLSAAIVLAASAPQLWRAALIQGAAPFLFLLLGVIHAASAAAPPQLRDGDIIFQTSRSAQSVAIQRASHSHYSHMGLILFRGDKPSVLEAVGPVQYTPLTAWINRGVGGHYVVKRLRNADTVLDVGAIEKLRRAAESFEGRPYDLTFEWSDSRMYCSELVWKAYDEGLGIRIGSLQRLRDFDLSDPDVQAQMKQRYGSKVPLDEPVISPAAMFAAPNLVTVVTH